MNILRNHTYVDKRLSHGEENGYQIVSLNNQRPIVSKPYIIANEKLLVSSPSDGSNTKHISDRSKDESLSQPKDLSQSVRISHDRPTISNYEQKSDQVPIPSSCTFSDTSEHLDNSAGNVSDMHNIDIVSGPDFSALSDSQPSGSVPGGKDCEDQQNGDRGTLYSTRMITMLGLRDSYSTISHLPEILVFNLQQCISFSPWYKKQ